MKVPFVAALTGEFMLQPGVMTTFKPTGSGAAVQTARVTLLKPR